MPDNRSRGRILLEDVLRIRVKPNIDPNAGLAIVKPEDSLGSMIEEADGSSLFDFSQLNVFRTLTDDRDLQYKMYDDMGEDSIIAAALELYADDATQYNTKGQVIWAESDDGDVAAFTNRLIDILQLNENAWSHIYSLVKYGDLYLELFKDDEIGEDLPLLSTDTSSGTVKIRDNREGAKLVEYLEAVPNPAQMYDLSRHGKTVGFIRVPVEPSAAQDRNSYGWTYLQQGQDIDILPPDKFVHIMLSTNTNRFPETLNVILPDEVDKDGNPIQTIDSTDEAKVVSYRVNRGKSILYDIYKIYRELKLMEDSLLLNRVTRSSIIRIVQVEMGDMPADNERNVLKRLKQLIEQKNFMDKNAETFTSMANPGPVDNIIYVPTRDGKGSISTQNLGGDPDVKSIVDMDYFSNKLYGGLKIPKQFLGDTDDAAGFSGGTSLTKLDSRYARTIKRIQNSYIAGITTLINLFALSKGLTDYVNNFTIRMTSPATTEDAEREETQRNRIAIMDDFLRVVDDNQIISPKTKKEIIMQFLNNYLNEPEIAELIEQDDTAEKTDEGEEERGMDFDRGGPSGGGFDMGPDLGGEPFGDFEENEEIDFDNNELNFEDNEMETEPEGGVFEVTPEEFGDFEDMA